MAAENVEIVRKFFLALANDDFDSLLAFFHPEVEWRPTEGDYRGPEGVVSHMAEWIEPWDEHEIKATEVTAVDDHVLAVIRLTARGAGSRMEIDQDFFQIYTVTGGKIVRMVEFLDRGEAVRAAESQE